MDYARHFLQLPNINISMFMMLIVGPWGRSLLREVKRKKSDRAVYIWTVNAESWMKWSIRQEFDGVITDDPKRYLEVCKNYRKDEILRHSRASWKAILWQHWRALWFGFSFRLKHGFWIDMKRVRESLGGGI